MLAAIDNETVSDDVVVVGSQGQAALPMLSASSRNSKGHHTADFVNVFATVLTAQAHPSRAAG